jgi:class 3 adenylate cyclase
VYLQNIEQARVFEYNFCSYISIDHPKLKMLMRIFFPILYCFFTFLPHNLLAQYKPIDSLYFTLVKYEDERVEIDSSYVNSLNQLANNLYQVQPDTALFYAQKALKISELIHYPKGKAYAIKQQSLTWTGKKEYAKALDSWHKTVIAYAQINNTQEIANGLENIGDLHLEQENKAEALEYYQKSFRNYEVIRDKKGSTTALNKIAEVYFLQEKFEKSEATAQQALDLAKENKFFAEASKSTTILYKIAKQDKDFPKALSYHELAKQYNDSVAIINQKEASKKAALDKKDRYKQIQQIQELLKKNEDLRKVEQERQELLRLALEKQNKKDGSVASELAKKEKELQNLQKTQAILKKDKELQRIEAEREKNARLVLQYHSEAERLLASARQEKDKHKQDSLHSLAKSKQAEVDIYLRKEQKLKAEGKQRELEVLREKEAKEFQQVLNYIALVGLLAVLIFAYFIYKSRQNVQKEKQKSEALLLNILPEATAQELKETGTSTPKYYELVTVLFTDFKGFTHIAEQFTPTQVIEELNYCFLAFDEICEKYNLEKIKTIGDAYMCAGGLPLENTTNPVDVVSAGLEMQAWMANWKQQKEAKGAPIWELRLGIHSGEVVAGVIGKNKFAYDIWGDTVNLASRMESSGEVGKVNISGATYELIKDKFQCTHRGAIKAKNKGDVDMYFVEQAL